MWDTTLRTLHRSWNALAGLLGNIEMPQAVWDRLSWRTGDTEGDQLLKFEEVEKLCKRLNMSSNWWELLKVCDSGSWPFSPWTNFPSVAGGHPDTGLP
jgi:phosphatidylinositol phospholipase C delta